MFLTMKQSFTERKIFNELEKQIKKSKKFEFSEKSEICNLDNIDIRFQTHHDVLEVFDKTGKKILSLWCECRVIDKTSHMRHRRFYSLRDMAVKRAGVENQVKKTEKTVETVMSEKQKHQIMLNEALQRIRGA